jgi:hypothetical protein
MKRSRYSGAPPVTKIRSLEHPNAVRGRPGSDANQCMLHYQHNTPKFPHRIILSSQDLIKRRIFFDGQNREWQERARRRTWVLIISIINQKKSTNDTRRAVHETLQKYASIVG